MSEWGETTLGALVRGNQAWLQTGPFGTALKANEYREEGTPLISVRELRDGRIVVDEKTPRLGPETLKRLPRYLLHEGDIVFGRKGAIERCGRITKSQEGFFLGSDGICLRLCDEIDSAFVSYQLRSKQIATWLMANAGGTTMPSMNQSVLDRLPLRISSLSTQRRIAAVLSALDDKIELNNRINANLEAQAQALFRSWFVDFEPWGGTMPEGWKHGTLLDIADYCNGLAMQKFRPVQETGLPVLKIRELRQGFCDAECERCSSGIDSKFIVDDGDVVFSWSGSLLVDVWCGGKAGLNQHLFKVTSRDFPKWFYLMWTKFHLDDFATIAANMATTMGHIKRGELERADVLLLDECAMERFSAVMEPLLDSQIQRRIQNRVLAELRDTLLPKLMSGEIDVSRVEVPA